MEFQNPPSVQAARTPTKVKLLVTHALLSTTLSQVRNTACPSLLATQSKLTAVESKFALIRPTVDGVRQLALPVLMASFALNRARKAHFGPIVVLRAPIVPLVSRLNAQLESSVFKKEPLQ